MSHKPICFEADSDFELSRGDARRGDGRGARPRVLVADDSAEIRDSLGRLLRRANYDVSFAAHGGHVLDAAFNDRVDLLLLDLNMPRLNGWDSLDRLATLVMNTLGIDGESYLLEVTGEDQAG